MRIISFLFLSIFLNHCFFIPRVRIYKALSLVDCSRLSQNLIYDLQEKDLKKGIDLCSKNKKYRSAIQLAIELEKQTPLKKRKQIWIKKFDLYHNYLMDYKSSSIELKKILKEDPYQVLYVKNLIQSYLKSRKYGLALQKAEEMMAFKGLSLSQNLEFQFIKARILMLSQNRKESLKVFKKIKKRNKQFFKENEGPFYMALLLEETKDFDAAIEELEQADWVFSEEKKKHWQYRKENAP